MVGTFGGGYREAATAAPTSLLSLMDDHGAPPENSAVLDYIKATNDSWNAQLTPWGGGGPFVGNEDFRAASQPGMSGYWNIEGGRLVPRVFSPSQVAQQAGLRNPGELMRGFTPTDEYAQQRYDIPNDRGGFFNLPQVGGLPSAGYGWNTNNWRLLGHGPGYIMRMGNLINTNDPAVRAGLWAGQNQSFSDTAESGAPGRIRYASPGAALSGRNVWGSAYWPGQQNAVKYNPAYEA